MSKLSYEFSKEFADEVMKSIKDHYFGEVAQAQRLKFSGEPMSEEERLQRTKDGLKVVVSSKRFVYERAADFIDAYNRKLATAARAKKRGKKK